MGLRKSYNATKLCIYGVGLCGNSLAKLIQTSIQSKESLFLGVDYFSDTDADKHGKWFHEIPCVPIEDLLPTEKETLIIVAVMADGEFIVKDLRNRGFSNVIFYETVSLFKNYMQQILASRVAFREFLCSFLISEGELVLMGGPGYGSFSVSVKTLKKEDQIIVYSGGIGENIDFDRAILEHYPNAQIYAFDPTPNTIKWVEENVAEERFQFYPYGLSDFDGSTDFSLPIKGVSGSIFSTDTMLHVEDDASAIVDVKKISTIMEELDHKKIDILKIDIEGSEFQLIPDILASNIDIAQICFEEHSRFFEDGDLMLLGLIKLLINNSYIMVCAKGSEYTFEKVYSLV